MGKLWNRAAGALKDHNSILVANMSRRTTLRRPEVDAAVIRATSHDETAVDYAAVERVYRLIRNSGSNFRPLIWAISRRMEKTRNWAVAIKGLMLMHSIFSSKIPAVQMIGRLPFDLSNFKDGRYNSWKTWGLDEFVRAYFAFLDHKFSLLFLNLQERNSPLSLMQALEMLQKMQDLLEKTMKIRPNLPATVTPLVIEAMDCVVVEIFAIHDRICTGISKVVPKILSAGKAEAAAALKIATRITTQIQELDDYFELCNEIGVSNATKPPATDRISKEHIQELEDVINGVGPVSDEPMALVPVCSGEARQQHSTIITDRWETFDDDVDVVGEYHVVPYSTKQPSLPHNNNLNVQCHHFPDLITF